MTSHDKNNPHCVDGYIGYPGKKNQQGQHHVGKHIVAQSQMLGEKRFHVKVMNDLKLGIDTMNEWHSAHMSNKPKN